MTQLTLSSIFSLSTLTADEERAFDRGLDYAVGRGWFPVAFVGTRLAAKLVDLGLCVEYRADRGARTLWVTDLGLENA